VCSSPASPHPSGWVSACYLRAPCLTPLRLLFQSDPSHPRLSSLPVLGPEESCLPPPLSHDSLASLPLPLPDDSDNNCMGGPSLSDSDSQEPGPEGVSLRFPCPFCRRRYMLTKSCHLRNHGAPRCPGSGVLVIPPTSSPPPLQSHTIKRVAPSGAVIAPVAGIILVIFCTAGASPVASSSLRVDMGMGYDEPNPYDQAHSQGG